MCSTQRVKKLGRCGQLAGSFRVQLTRCETKKKQTSKKKSAAYRCDKKPINPRHKLRVAWASRETPNDGWGQRVSASEPVLSWRPTDVLCVLYRLCLSSPKMKKKQSLLLGDGCSAARMASSSTSPFFLRLLLLLLLLVLVLSEEMEKSLHPPPGIRPPSPHHLLHHTHRHTQGALFLSCPHGENKNRVVYWR